MNAINQFIDSAIPYLAFIGLVLCIAAVATIIYFMAMAFVKHIMHEEILELSLTKRRVDNFDTRIEYLKNDIRYLSSNFDKLEEQVKEHLSKGKKEKNGK